MVALLVRDVDEWVGPLRLACAVLLAPAAEAARPLLPDDDLRAVARCVLAMRSEWVPLVDCVGSLGGMPEEPHALLIRFARKPLAERFRVCP